MAAPAPKIEPLVDDRKPDVALGNVIDAISALKDRGAVLRRLETEDAAAKAGFEEVARREWAALEELRASYDCLSPERRDIAALDAVIAKQAAIANMKRAVHDAVLEMVRGLIPTVATATGHSEDWVRQALEFITFPAQREAQHAIDLHFELEALASEMDPENGLSGDVLGPGADFDGWWERMLASK